MIFEAQGIRHRYPTGTDALRGVDLQLDAGEIVGLIGPDGAGKSTLFRILMGLQRPTSGTVACGTQARALGYVPQSFSLAPDLTVEENLQLQARLFGLAEPEPRLRQLLEAVDLQRYRQRLSGALSGGMKQKLALCVALLPDPPALLLDEPTTGVDPVSRREFWALLHEVHDRGVAILFSTPYLDEAEYAHRMLLMNQGHVLASGSLESFQAQMPGQVLSLTTVDRPGTLAWLEDQPLLDRSWEGDTVRIRVASNHVDAVVAQLSQRAEVASFRRETASLEDFFLHALRATEVAHG